MIKHYCDYCGKEIGESYVGKQTLKFELNWQEYEFCSDLCLKSFLEDNKEKVEEQNKAKEEIRLQGMESKIDYLEKITSELKNKICELERKEKEKLVYIPSKGPY